MSCPACFSGFEMSGTPTGVVETVHGLPTYVARPSPSSSSEGGNGDSDSNSPRGVMVIIPDAFGWEFVNNRIVADNFAQRGFVVYLPDFMNGESNEWRRRGRRMSREG
jgi:dienelactone hydrolase